MAKKFKIDNDHYGEGIKMYKKCTVEFKPGLTVLVGCNGAGKTTLLKQLYKKVQNENIPCVMFDNLHNGGSYARQKAVFCNDFQFVATSMCSSEGENILLNMQAFSNMIYRMFSNNPHDQEYWILADAIDSGLSIDNIVDLKDGLFKEILDIHKEKDVYIIVSANAYEMANGEQCFNVTTGKYVPIKSYDKYRSVVLKSREVKDTRNEST